MGVRTLAKTATVGEFRGEMSSRASWLGLPNDRKDRSAFSYGRGGPPKRDPQHACRQLVRELPQHCDDAP
jgi:hypothetical protein